MMLNQTSQAAWFAIAFAEPPGVPSHAMSLDPPLHSAYGSGFGHRTLRALQLPAGVYTTPHIVWWALVPIPFSWTTVIPPVRWLRISVCTAPTA